MDPAQLLKNLHWYLAALNPSKLNPTGVHDGDTVDAVIDMGGFIYIHKSIRVANVNAPELANPDGSGKAARDWAQGWFKGFCPIGQFFIHTHLDPSDKYGRFLAMIYAPNGACFNDDIVAAGHAVPFEVEPY